MRFHSNTNEGILLMISKIISEIGMESAVNKDENKENDKECTHMTNDWNLRKDTTIEKHNHADVCLLLEPSRYYSLRRRIWEYEDNTPMSCRNKWKYLLHMDIDRNTNPMKFVERVRSMNRWTRVSRKKEKCQMSNSIMSYYLPNIHDIPYPFNARIWCGKFRWILIDRWNVIILVSVCREREDCCLIFDRSILTNMMHRRYSQKFFEKFRWLNRSVRWSCRRS